MKFKIILLFLLAAATLSSTHTYKCTISLFEYVREADSISVYKNPAKTEVEIKAPSAINLNKVPVTFYHDCPELNFELAIYNRWGNEVFKTEDKGEPWYFEYDGKQLPIGTYMWRLKYKIGKREDIQEATGSITLLK